MAGVAEQVVKHPGQLVRVAVIFQAGGKLQGAGQVPLPQHGGELADHLLEHPAQVHGLLLQLQMAEVEAGDLKEFIDELLQTLRLVQGDAGVAGAQLRGELGLVTEQCQIADDAGEGGLQVVGQIDHQVVFPLLRLPGGPLGTQGLLPGQVQLVLHALHGGGQADGLLRGTGELGGGADQRIQLANWTGDEVPADDHPAQQDHRYAEKEVVVPDPQEQVVERVGLIPGKAAAHQDPQGGDRQHHGHPGHQGQQIIPPALEGAVEPTVCLEPLRQTGLAFLTQWCSPPPTQS